MAAATLQGSALGALLTLAARPLFPFYAGRTALWHLTPLEDQQLAGIVMWVPAAVVYLVAVAALFLRWWDATERETVAAEVAAA